MKAFQHVNASTIEDALGFLREPRADALAGGTDLLQELKSRIRTPERLINLKTIPGMNRILPESGGVQIGALARVSAIEANPLLKERFPVIGRASALIASPQIRNMGTLGGNLCQGVRCWYYRHPEVTCWMKGGGLCYARNGLNQHHAIFGRAPCVAVNPSDLGVVLLALDATVYLAGPAGDYEMPLERLYRLPDAEHRRQVVLKPGHLIRKVSIPSRPEWSEGVFLKTMERSAWSFALVSVAVRLYRHGETVEDARVVLGGVAGIPWRAHKAEDALKGRRIDEALAEKAAGEALSEAKPLGNNQYKVVLARNLMKRALVEVWKQPSNIPPPGKSTPGVS